MKKILNSVICRLVLMAGWLYGWWVFRVVNRVTIIGRENIPRQKNLLFVANHQTLIDSFLIGVAVSRFTDIIFNYQAIPWNAPDKKNFFSKKWLGFIFQYLKNIPATRGSQSRDSVFGQIKEWGEKLKDGALVLFFEGTRSRTGQIGECHSGVAKVVSDYRPTVVPIFLEDIGPILPIETGYNFLKPALPFKKRHHSRLIIGPFFNFNGESRKDIAVKLRDIVINLSAS